MPVRIIPDCAEWMRYSRDKDGGALTRIFIVEGLVSNSATLYNATIAQDIGGYAIPQMWQAHELIPGLFVNNITAEPFAQEGRQSARVTVTYGWQNLKLGMFKISGTRQVINANKDPETRKFFTVTYTDPNGVTASNYCMFDVFTCHIMLEFNRIEKTSPKQKSATYTTAINEDAGWQGIGATPGLWLCNSISGPQIGDKQYDVTYCFEYAPEGWYQLGFFQDKLTHVTPSDVFNTKVPANIVKTGQIGGVKSGLFGYVPKILPFSNLKIPNA